MTANRKHPLVSAAALALAAGPVALVLPAAAGDQTGAGDWFSEGAAQTGITFLHFNGMSGRLYHPEIVGPGAALIDHDNDGWMDVYVNRHGSNTLWHDDHDGTFSDLTADAGVDDRRLSVGASFLDFDRDGWLDLCVVNAAVRRMGEAKVAADPFPLRQTNQLFANLGDSHFREVTQDAGAALRMTAVGRGAAFGDIDNDGATDVLIVNNSGAPLPLLDTLGNGHPWMGLRLLDAPGRDALGARVAVELDSGRTLWRRAHTDGSDASASDPRIILGLGQGKARVLRVQWPSGRTETWPVPDEGRYRVLREGTAP